jgi:hypothetical protein
MVVPIMLANSTWRGVFTAEEFLAWVLLIAIASGENRAKGPLNLERSYHRG